MTDDIQVRPQEPEQTVSTILWGWKVDIYLPILKEI